MTERILQGDCREVLATLPAESVQMVCTSPPYWGLRDYKVESGVWGGDRACNHAWIEHRQYKDSPTRVGCEGIGFDNPDVTRGQRWSISCGCECGAWLGALGLEPTPDLFVAHLVEVFAAVHRVLAKDGVLWLNLSDTYATGAGQGNRWLRTHDHWQPNRLAIPGLKKGDRVGIPHRVAFALQAAGWWWRDEVVWQKTNPMPSSAGNRTTPCHEMLFLLTKSAKYFSDFDSIAEPSVGRTWHDAIGSARVGIPGQTKQDGHGRRHAGFNERYFSAPPPTTRNKRSVWTIPTQPRPEAHFATFPDELARLCILAGSRPGDTVLDPFGGRGTVAVQAKALGRHAIHVDLNPEYIAMAERNVLAQNPPLPFGEDVA